MLSKRNQILRLITAAGVMGSAMGWIDVASLPNAFAGQSTFVSSFGPSSSRSPQVHYRDDNQVVGQNLELEHLRGDQESIFGWRQMDFAGTSSHKRSNEQQNHTDVRPQGGWESAQSGWQQSGAPQALPVAPQALPVAPQALPVAPQALPVAPKALPDSITAGNVQALQADAAPTTESVEQHPLAEPKIDEGPKELPKLEELLFTPERTTGSVKPVVEAPATVEVEWLPADLNGTIEAEAVAVSENEIRFAFGADGNWKTLAETRAAFSNRLPSPCRPIEGATWSRVQSRLVDSPDLVALEPEFWQSMSLSPISTYPRVCRPLRRHRNYGSETVRVAFAEPAQAPPVAQAPSVIPPAPEEPQPLPNPATVVDEPETFGNKEQFERLEKKLEEQPLQFLRQQSVLLDPGEVQFDIGVHYLTDTNDFPVIADLGGGNFVALEAQRRQRILSHPIEMRMGLTEYTQGFINLPVGFAWSEVQFNGVEETDRSYGLGDLSAGLTHQLVVGNQYLPSILGTVSFSAPTSNSNFSIAGQNPNSTLGQGIWTITAGLNFVQTIDPVVWFGGLGYTARIQREYENGIKVDPGDILFYRFGTAFAVNPRVTYSAAFVGSYIGDTKVQGFNDISPIEPLSLRFAATIAKLDQKCHFSDSPQLVEPFVSFGLTDDATDAILGVTFTH